MQFDSLTLCATVAQLRQTVGDGCRVVRVFQTSRLQTVLELDTGTPCDQLVLSCCPQFGRTHLDEGWTPDPAVNYPLGGVLRRWLRSAVLVGVAQHQFDRVVRLQFANARALGPQSRFCLTLEIMGRHSNLIALDADDIILEAARHVTAEVNRYRQVLPGLEYVPPPDFGKHHPGLMTGADLRTDAAERNGTVGAWFRAGLQGASDTFRDEALARAHMPSDTPTAVLRPEDFERLQRVLADLLDEACAGAPMAWVYHGPATLFAYPVRLQSQHDCRPVEYPDISSAVAHVARAQMSGSDLEQQRRRLLQAVQRARETVAKRVAERAEAKQRARDADSVRRQGEALLAYLNQVPRGSSEVALPDPHDQERILHIALDPRLSAQDNAQKYFSRYKKLVAMQQRIGLLLQAARRDRHYLEGLLDQIQEADGAGQMRDLETEIIQQGYLKRPRKRVREDAPTLAVNSTSLKGYTIMWGNSGLQNDKLLRLAGPEDIWLHTRKTPGGHVLIRTGGRPEQVPEEVLQAAAAHAARLSKRRNDSRVAVDYALAKHVRRLKGTPPGYVHYANHQTMHVQPANLEHPQGG